MDDEKNIFRKKRGIERRNSDPRIIEGRFYGDPIDICRYIQDIVHPLIMYGKNHSEQLNVLLSEVSELADYVRSDYHFKKNDPIFTINKNRIISLANVLKKLAINEEFWDCVDMSYFSGEESKTFRDYAELPPLKTKKELKGIMEFYVNVLNYFFLENYSPENNPH